MRSASDSAFRNVFSRFRRGLPQGRPGYLRVAATLYLVFCTQLREQIHQPVASVYAGKHYHLLEPTKGTRDLMCPWSWSLRGFCDHFPSHIHTEPRHVGLLQWSNALSAFLQQICSIQVWDSGTGVEVEHPNWTGRFQANTELTLEKVYIRNGRGQTLHFQNMCFLEFISLWCWI